MSNMEIAENKIGLRIKVLREGRRMSRLDLAKKMDVSDCAVCYWEAGKRKPSLRSARLLSKIFHVSVAFIYAEEGGFL